MSQNLNLKHYDVVVIGGGSAGVAAAIAATKNGARTLLVESGPFVGGELVSGLPIDGCLNALGEWIVGGIATELFDGLKELDGYVGPLFDWRLCWTVAVDPEVFKLVIVDGLARHEIPVLLYTFAEDVVTDNGRLEGIVVVNKNQRTLITGDVFVDCSGDGDIAALAGADYEKGDEERQFQPLSLLFRMANVDFKAFLEFVRDNSHEFMLGENPTLQKTREECAFEIYKSGYPFAGLTADGPMLSRAIQSGEMYPCTFVYCWPTSMVRREVAFNTTRIANIDATDTEKLSETLPTLIQQVRMATLFVKNHLPGFQQAQLSGIAPKIGVRETRRILGEYVLTAEDVINGRKSEDGIAKGGHHIDIHGSETYQKRVPVKGGQSYDVPYGCLIPSKLKNVLVAGRCISSTREANGSVRVMAQCMATGQAAGTAAALCIACDSKDVRNVPIRKLRQTLKAQGAVIDGTH